MHLDRKRRAYAIVRDALDVATGERAAHVARACGDDAALRAEVEVMLASDGDGMLDRTAAGVAARLAGLAEETESAEPALPPGTQIGAWRVLEPLGQGGMGTVYLVERDGDGYVQRGALKLIKRGMDSAAVVARFRNERRILSRLTQPNIARLLDGGVAADGRSFLVMEYVDGEPLSDWAARTGAGLDARIALFLQICEAVAHAHRQLVVHRDIKPANVLVDARGVPRLLDFGIAKVLGDDDGARTATAANFLSPAYAAPEQRAGGDVSTATDIYQLGLLLFELLTGQRFHAGATHGGAHPSQRLAQARQQAGPSGPAAIAPKQLRGDAGVIVARATDAEPGRRYATVEALADDLRRWRNGRPILARPDSAAYRLRRFVARHRVAAALGAVAVLALLVGAGLALWQAQRAEREAQLARSAQAFLTGVFDAASPDAEVGARVTARELLDRGAERVERDLAGEPHLRADMLVTLGRLYRQLGQYDQAHALLARARDTWPADGASADAPRRLRMLAELGTVERLRGRLDDARVLFDAVLAGDAPADVRSHVLIERALLHDERGDFETGLADARAALALDRARGAEAAFDVVRDRHAEALLLARIGRFDEAQQVFDETIAVASAQLGPDDTRVAQMYNDYAVLMMSSSRPEPAEAAARRALDARRRRLGDAHPAVAESLQVLGGPLRQLGRLDDAQASLEEALAIQRKVYGEYHTQVATSLNSLGILAATRQRYAEAERYTRAALDNYRALGSDRTVNTATITTNLAVALTRQGKLAEARPLLEDALALHRRLLGDRHPAVFSDENALSQLCLREGDIAGALAHARAAVTIGDALFQPGRETAAVHLTLANALLRGGHADEALAEARGASAILDGIGVGKDARAIHALAVQADALIDLGRIDEAAPLAERVLQERAEADVPSRIAAHALMARLALAQGRSADAVRERARARTLLDTLETPDPELALDIGRD